MHKLYFSVLLIVSLFFSINLHAQYITPGNNLVLTLEELVLSSGGVVSNVDGVYQINNTLTISATDTLRISEAAVIRVAAGIRLEVSGTIVSDPIDGLVHFTAIDTTTASSNFKGFRFDDSPANVFRNTIISYGGGLQLIGSEALFEYCTFRKNGSSNVSAAITYSASSPIIRYCSFIENARSAVGSGANVSGSPQIMYNVLIHNTTDNSNRPQINIGPGAGDSLYIVGNYIEGLHDNVGGIGLSNLLATGNTKAVVRDNYVVGNRYGYAQIGNNISSVITDNAFLDNNIQNQPNLGGSGLNFLASGSGNTAIVRRNIIKGNLWGVTIQNSANPNFGTADDPGENIFFENGNGGSTYALYNNTALPVNAIGNYWGTNDPVEAEDFIFHQPDQASLGIVSYLPLLTLEPEIQFFMFAAADNPELTTDVFGEINPDDLSIAVTLPAGTSINALIPQIGIPLGVITDPIGGEPTDFTNPVSYTVLTPHGETAEYTVTVGVEVATYTLSFTINGNNGEPLSDASITLNGNSYPAGTYVFDNLLPGTYAYSISHPDYFTEDGSIELIDQSLNIDITMNPLSYTVTFIPEDEAGSGLPGVVITFDGITYDPGVYVINEVLPGTYSYLAEKEGHEAAAGTITVVDQDLNIEITLPWLRYNLIFTVADADGNPLEDVLVEVIGHSSQLTTNDGSAYFPQMLPGTYTWQASKEGYQIAEGAAIIVDEDLVVPVEMELIIGIDELIEKLKIYPSPAVDFIKLESPYAGEIQVSVCNLQGRQLIRPQVFIGQHQLQLGKLPAGQYFLLLDMDGKQYSKGFIKR